MSTAAAPRTRRTRTARARVLAYTDQTLKAWMAENLMFNKQTGKPMPIATAVACAEHYYPDDDQAQERLLRKLNRLVYEVLNEKYPVEQFNVPE